MDTVKLANMFRSPTFMIFRDFEAIEVSLGALFEVEAAFMN